VTVTSYDYSEDLVEMRERDRERERGTGREGE